MEQLIKQARFVTMSFNGQFIVEINVMHPSNEYTMNLRATADTLKECTAILEHKLSVLLYSI